MQVNEAQYGLGDLDDNGDARPGGKSGEEVEAERLETGSIPQLEALLRDLESQIEL